MTPALRNLIVTASHWERMHTGWATRSRDVPEPTPPTTQAQLHEAQDALVSAVRALRAEAGQ